jgi:HD-GYP domain-containing protein (c-di-GMP phosphodiesterase class II)
MSSTIAVEDLRIGMYIHLEGGWLSHPFPLSSFKLATADQIATLHSLGLERVRWVPEKSELPVPAPAPLEGKRPPPPPSAEEAAALARREWLAAQRAAAQLCERQYGEAAKAWRQASEAVASQPQQAGRTAQTLTRAMLDKMLGTEELGVRLVNGGGDRAASPALNVAVISLLIGRAMGLEEDAMTDLGIGALMHDIGKLDVAERFRHAEEGFGGSELAAYRDHVAKGVLQGQRMGLSAGALQVLAQHHEQADGQGFPQRLAGDRTSMGARIVAIVNRFDNLCNPGSLAHALTPHEAVAMLFAQGRARFDGAVLNAFIRMMGVYPAGSLVQLTDDRYAMVVGANSSRPLKPRVLVCDAPKGRPERDAEPQMLDLESVPDLGIRRSLAPNKVPPAVLAALDPRPRVAYYFEPLGHRPESLEPGA